MTDRAVGVQRDVAGVHTRLLLQYLELTGGPKMVAQVLGDIGETRTVAELTSDATWISYAQFRRLLETAAELLGGPESLRAVGPALWEVDAHPLLADRLQPLGSVEGILEQAGAIARSLESFAHVETERVGDGEWLVRSSLDDGYEAYRARCEYGAGVLAQLPMVLGFGAAEVVEEACRVDGAPCCTYRVSWDVHRSPADETIGRLTVRTRVLEARIEALQDTVAELVSGESLDVVLHRVVQAAARAVLARGFVLALDLSMPGRRHVYWEGIDAAEARACVAALRAGGDVDPRWTVVEVTSRRGHHGRLVALHDRPDILGHERLVLEAYGRLAAAALDSATVLQETTRQAEIATALLRLSQSLSEIGTSDQVAARLAEAATAIVDCDCVVVSLREDDSAMARVVAAHGYGEESDRRIEGTIHAVDEGLLDAERVHVLRAGDVLSTVEQRALGGAAAVAIVPLHAGGEVLGWVGVIAQDRPERLLEHPDLVERLQGLAGQAATALRNAQLMDRIRFQADHDPLTGLANQRLLETHAVEAIERARRAGARVGLLFLDLDDFKDVNDRQGHAVGDRLLLAVTDRLRATLRDGDTVARFGGDEFVILLPLLSDAGAAVRSKIKEAFAEPFVIGDLEVHTTTSIGTAIFPEDGGDFGELLKQADIRMYEDKLVGRQRNRFNA